jgi:hypothetical protein
MLMTKERHTTVRTPRGWAVSVLQETDATRECEAHGWMEDHAGDLHARDRAYDVARQDPRPTSLWRKRPLRWRTCWIGYRQ